MPDATVIPLRARAPSAYSDTAALNDIHTLLTVSEPGGATLADIAQILARTGRPMTRVRDIEVSHHRDGPRLARCLHRCR